ncbi:uncharacterized protein BROUX77_002204 [Berkeleyomyces rouxiae]|uniref:uncharacterized protein n=1 Tax=Berkeleyomyces rouxiae TaxID=2035830 RepID=UPI003B7ADE83
MRPSFSSLVAATLAVSQACLALPPSSPFSNPISTSRSEHNGAWSIKQVRNTDSRPDGLMALASIYKKYNRPIPENLEAIVTRNRKRDQFFATISDVWGTVSIPTRIGLPGQVYNLILDTASSGIWVLSEQAAKPELQAAYNPENSDTADLMKDYSWEIRHLAGEAASGDVYLDFVSITPHDGIRCRSQAVQVANYASGLWNVEHISGVMGLAFSSRNPIKPEPQPNIFDNMANQLDEKIFTVDLQHIIGIVDFGYIDKDKYAGEIGYADIFTEDGYWNFTIEGLMSDTTPPASGIEYAIADTATSLLMLPMTYASAYYKRVPNAWYSIVHGGFVFPCSSEMPDFSFKVGGVEIAIPGDILRFSSFNQKATLCFGGLQPSDELGFNIVGTVAFKSAFVVFDPVNFKIGWAKKW